jgi:hypothetical protein
MHCVKCGNEFEVLENKLMSMEEAVEKLWPVRHKRIELVYEVPDYQEALRALDPDFEYPDWDWRTVGEYLKVHGYSK